MKQEIKDEIRKIAAEKNILMREAKREALTRIEERAQTVEDFEKLFEEWWNVLASNRERNERRNEYLMDDKMFDWNTWDKGDFIDLIYRKPSEMYHLVEDVDLSRLIKESTQKQKAVFFPLVIRGCGTKKISECHCMTDRNVRKLCDLMKENIRREMAVILEERKSREELLTVEQREFLSWYKPKEKSETKKARLDENQTEL